MAQKGIRAAAAPEPPMLKSQAARKMTLLHITTVPMTFMFLRGQLNYMKSKGMDVHVMAAPGPAMSSFAQDEGVSAHPIEMARRITPLADLRTLFRMVLEIRRIRPDVVHASTPKGGLLGSIAARLAGVPFVLYHVRGLPYTAATGIQRLVLRSAERVACVFAHRVLCVSNSVREQMVRDSLVKPNKTFVLLNGSSNGVDAAQRFNPDNFNSETKSVLRKHLKIPQNAVVIGFVGRMVGDKGLNELARAFESISKTSSNAHLLLVGGWENRDAVGATTRTWLTNHSRVHRTGEQADTAGYYSVMDVLAFPTLREGFPNVPLEAAAMRVPIVATRVTGCVDAIIDGETGMLVEPRDPESLAGALNAYLSDDDLRKKHGSAGRERVLREFVPMNIWQALLDTYYAGLLRNGPSRHRKTTA